MKIVGLLLTALLCSAVPYAGAQQSQPAEDQRWDNWQAMGSGYVGRRKMPARAGEVTGEEIQDTGERQKVPKTAGAAIATAGQGADPLGRALWLYTQGKGLYAASISQLALQLGVEEETARDQATRGQLTLTSNGAAAPWHFDTATDSVLFVAEEYNTFYTGRNAYRLLLKASNKSVSMKVISGDAPTVAGTDAPYRESLHLEEEPDLNFALWAVASEPDADYWFWDYLYGAYKPSIETDLDLPDPAASGESQLRVRLRGWTDLEDTDEHRVYAEINGYPVGSTLTWDGFEEAVLVADFDQGILDPSGKNSLTLRSQYTPGSNPGQFLDDVEVDYQRLPLARDGMAWLRQPQAGKQAVGGFDSGDLVVVQLRNRQAKVRTDLRLDQDGSGGFTVSFSTDGKSDYLVAQRSALRAPAIAQDLPSRLRAASNSADYLIISPREFAGTAQALAELRGNQFGQVKIVWLDDIYDEFAGGREDPFAITRFMAQVQEKWLSGPAYVALLGKGTIDQKDRMKYADSFLPTVLTDTPWSLAPSDDRLLGGTGDLPLAFGRIPITSDAEGLAYVDKLIVHGNSLGDSGRRQALLVADNPDDAGDFHHNSDLMAERLLDSLWFDSVTKLYHSRDSVRGSLITDASWQLGYVSYDGHGSATQIGDGRENFIKAADASALRNTLYPVFSALTCAVGDFSYPGTRSLAGALVLNPAGGAIVAMAPTGLSLDADAQLLGNAYVDSLYSGYTVGTALRDAKAQTQGEVSSFMHRIYAVVGDPAVFAR